MTPKPESETDPWKAIQRYEFVQTNFAYTTDHEMERDAEGEWARWEAVDAARAAEAAQHQQEIAAKDDELVMLRKGLKEACRQNVELRAERDRLKAALSKITALDFEKFNGRHNFYSGAVMFVKAWLLAYAALTPQGQSTDGETR